MHWDALSKEGLHCILLSQGGIFDGYRKQIYLDNSMQPQEDGNAEAKEINLQKDDNQFDAEEVVEQWDVLCMDLTPKH
jgi:hypothetical protein